MRSSGHPVRHPGASAEHEPLTEVITEAPAPHGGRGAGNQDRPKAEGHHPELDATEVDDEPPGEAAISRNTRLGFNTFAPNAARAGSRGASSRQPLTCQGQLAMLVPSGSLWRQSTPTRGQEPARELQH